MKKPRVFEFVRDLRVDLSRWRTLAQANSDSMAIFDQTTDFALFQRLPSVASLPVSVDVLAFEATIFGGYVFNDWTRLPLVHFLHPPNFGVQWGLEPTVEGRRVMLTAAL